jgi:homoserine kinase
MNQENPLLKELLSNDKMARLRRESLSRSLEAMRTARVRRQAMRTCALGALPVLLLAWLWLHSLPVKHTEMAQNSTQTSHVQSVAIAARPSPEVETITDEQLFNLFPGRAVALIGKPGNQMFVVMDRQAKE